MSFHPKLRWQAFFQPPDVGFRISMVSVSINESVAVDVSYARKLIGNPSATGLIQQSVSEPTCSRIQQRSLFFCTHDVPMYFSNLFYTFLMQCLHQYQRTLDRNYGIETSKDMRLLIRSPAAQFHLCTFTRGLQNGVCVLHKHYRDIRLIAYMIKRVWTGA